MSFLEEASKAFESTDDLSDVKILSSLLHGMDKEFKTEIHNPSAFSALTIIAMWLTDEFGEDVSKFLIHFMSEFRINMISYKRKSRGEVVEALKAKYQHDQQVEAQKEVLQKVFKK